MEDEEEDSQFLDFHWPKPPDPEDEEDKEDRGSSPSRNNGKRGGKKGECRGKKGCGKNKGKGGGGRGGKNTGGGNGVKKKMRTNWQKMDVEKYEDYLTFFFQLTIVGLLFCGLMRSIPGGGIEIAGPLTEKDTNNLGVEKLPKQTPLWIRNMVAGRGLLAQEATPASNITMVPNEALQQERNRDVVHGGPGGSKLWATAEGDEISEGGVPDELQIVFEDSDETNLRRQALNHIKNATDPGGQLIEMKVLLVQEGMWYATRNAVPRGYAVLRRWGIR